MDEAIRNGPHVSACALDIVSFILGDMWRRLQDGLYDPAPPLFPSTLAPDPPVYPTPLTSVFFGPGILEALPYADLPQSPYPPPVINKADYLASTERTTAEDIRQAASLWAFIDSKQRITLGALPEAFTRPAATLMQSYVE